MIDRQTLKINARQRMRGRTPNTYFIAAVYITTVGVFAALIYALTGFDQVALHMENLLAVNPYPTSGELAAVIPEIPLLAIILIILIVVVRAVIDVGYMAYCLKICRNEDADTRTIFEGFSLFFKVIRLKILQLILICLWSVLFVFPGVAAYYSFRQSLYILLDRPELRPIDCIRESVHLMAGHRLELFFLDVSFIGWQIVDRAVEMLLTLRLLSIWLAPYIGVTRAGFYNRLISEDGSASGQA